MNNIFMIALGIAVFLADPTLAMSRTAFQDRDSQPISSKSQVKDIEYQDSNLALAKLDKCEVAKKKNLKKLSLGNANLGDSDLFNLKGLTQLEVLDLSNNPGLTSVGVKKITTNLINLNELKLNYTSIGNLSLFYLRAFTQLKVLDLSNNPGLTSVGVKKITTNLINLETLSFGSDQSLKKYPFGAPTLDDFFEPNEKDYLSSLLPAFSKLSKLKRIVSYYDETAMQRIYGSNLWFVLIN